MVFRPGRYGDIQLLQFLFRHRGQIEESTQHTLTHANRVLAKTAEIESFLSRSPNRVHTLRLPCEILEEIVSYLPPEDLTMAFAKASITWYLATLAATRCHLRAAIAETEALTCVLDGETAVLDYDSGKYPPRTEIRWVPIKVVERQRREVMDWYNVLCRVVGFKS